MNVDDKWSILPRDSSAMVLRLGLNDNAYIAGVRPFDILTKVGGACSMKHSRIIECIVKTTAWNVILKLLVGIPTHFIFYPNSNYYVYEKKS